ncbi:MAG: YbaN family protein [Pseudomonadota bacterium]
MRVVWLILGLLALGLGALGAVLPLLPTTPFVLLAAFAFARSSDRLHSWLLRHRVFGPLIKNWNETGSISPRAKLVSVISIVAVFGLSLALGVGTRILIVQAIVLSLSALFVLTRPMPPAN